MTAWLQAGSTGDVPDGEVVGVTVGGVPVALFCLDGTFHALHDLCTHGQARLSDGFVEDGCIECPLHQGLIDIATGAPRSAPVEVAVRSYPMRVVEDRIEIEL